LSGFRALDLIVFAVLHAAKIWQRLGVDVGSPPSPYQICRSHHRAAQIAILIVRIFGGPMDALVMIILACSKMLSLLAELDQIRRKRHPESHEEDFVR
jgi:hypothetical protein